MVRLKPFIKHQLVIRAHGIPRRCGAAEFPHRSKVMQASAHEFTQCGGNINLGVSDILKDKALYGDVAWKWLWLP
jgi:hypothetical protein